MSLQQFDAVSAAQWRGYRDRAVDAFLGPQFNPQRPPSVTEYLHQDGYSNPNPAAVCKVDRYAALVPAIMLQSAAVVTGHGRKARFSDSFPIYNHPLTDPFVRLAGDVGTSYHRHGSRLDTDPTSHYGTYLAIYLARTLGIIQPAQCAEEKLTILMGTTLPGEVRGFMSTAKTAFDRSKDARALGRAGQIAVYHDLVNSVELGRSARHLKDALAEPADAWGKAAESAQLRRSGPVWTLVDSEGRRLFPVDVCTAQKDTPRLKCPAQRYLGNLLYAAVSLAVEREII